ncbi:TATA-binding protein-associated factor 172-like protein [Dinothrombium tinctorium]|uniref:TATA-binding protein-associated factor 172-like protein n=1 Tax=Dinothrombium tinctorium TaxID=1965070 RepID=A0A443QR86_9ACAR|nr:TATA-binding protein-associated factor 172-like protein [Dinothrombium tinctorium]
MSSRLDRLFLLLDQGSTQSTRKAAALQLGEVQKLHPHELNNLLSKVRHYLHSNSWDTRIAAALAVEAIVKQVPLWLPQGISANAGDPFESVFGRITFDHFDVNTVIDCGRDLLASEGTEYDIIASNCDDSLDLKEKLAFQRQLLNQRLGLQFPNHLNLGFNINDFVSNEDLSQSTKSEDKTEDTASNGKKRHIIPNENFVKKIKTEKAESVDASNSVIDFSCINEWPLESFTDQLINDLFNPSWEVRHGASTALREILKKHGKCGGRLSHAPQHRMEELNQMWLEDLALRLFCVLALDKFGDFISDQVIAPVRETCAQTLGSIFGIMWEEKINSCVKILLELLKRREWEARHGGLLALKYLLAVRQDLTPILLPVVFEPIFNHLNDPVDDVSAVAASALIPVKDSLIKTLPEKVPILIEFLWDALLEIDDLTSSTSNILMLLSSLLNGIQSHKEMNFKNLIPRLWPFLDHHLSTVRKSVLEALLTLSSGDSLSFLDSKLLSDSLRLLYQRCLIEPKEDILYILFELWQQLIFKSDPRDLLLATFQFLSGWICLMMHPSKVAIDPNNCSIWLEVRHIDSQSQKVKKSDTHSTESEKFYLGGSDSVTENQSEREKCVIRARLQAAKCIGILACYLTKSITNESPSPLECLTNILLFHLNSKSAIQRTCVAWLIKEWSSAYYKKFTDDFAFPTTLINKCMDCLQDNAFYDEISSSFTRLQYDARDFISSLKQHKIPVDENVYKIGAVYTFQQISNLVTTDYSSSIESSKVKLKAKLLENLEEKRKNLTRVNEETLNLQSSLSTTVLSSVACALVSWNFLPEKLNPVVRPLMDSIKREENDQLQKTSAFYITKLIHLYIQKPRIESSPSPISKIIKNLITFLCSNETFALNINATSPLSHHVNPSGSSSSSGSSSPSTPTNDSGILTLYNMQKNSEKVTQMRRTNSLNATKKNNESFSLDEVSVDTKEETEKCNEIMKRGSTFALCEIAKFFEERVKTALPQLWEKLNFVSQVTSELEDVTQEKAQELLQSLQVLEVLTPHLHSSLHSYLIELLPSLCICLGNVHSAIRHMASRCLGVLSTVITTETMNTVVVEIMGMLGATDSDIKRQGAVEAIYCIIEKLRIAIVPYIVLLIVPMLGRMSDQNESVRILATHCFAQLIQLMPLDTVVTSPDLKPELLSRKQEEQHFLEQLMNPKNLDDYKIPIPINAELRSYQQQGINWLAFLNKYKLHGILCDEMGLGKTLMSLCMLASDHYNRSKKYLETKSDDCKPLPSLVICPPTLTGHWVYEVEKFVDSSYLNPLNYSGPPTERTRLRSKLKRQNNHKSYNLVIASYDIVRNDIDFFSSIVWNYCILDEGHIIKNGKTKLAKAIKSLTSNHRVILTGTPIQNNVLELWSLFDFLMPGFLGTERQFMARYSKPIFQSRDAKSSSKEQEAGVLAMESLHRQVLPFILRRMKEDVLKDLPPKIIQDYYCDLSPLQSRLYEDFSKSHVRQTLESSLSKSSENSDNSSSIMTTHIFQALQYLRKVCNHPKLVLTPQHPEYTNVISFLKAQNSSLSDINHAAKLCALKQLLLDCGIGCQTAGNVINESEPVVNQHRALIFCQLKGMLDILENDLFKNNMPSVTYLRLDGSIPPSSRHSVVHRFNNDPSIDVLLLTTQVGGLGLNLTGADTVIFVEHDWNPMKDLQAMDRAHRIGQKKVVNVYRLITTGTLEEKIMGLQKFKLTIANTVISHDNSCLSTMRTDQLLDLFTLNAKENGNDEKASKNVTGMKSVLENLPELWDTDQYEEEYDLTNFIKSLNS